MNRACAVWMALLCPTLLWAAPAPPHADPFSLDKLHVIHVHVSAEGWKMMQPTHDNFWSRLFAPPPATRPVDDKSYHEGDRLKPNPMGNLYAYAKASIDFDGHPCADAGLRFKGNSSYWAGTSSLHRPLKLDFARFHDGQRLLGLRQLNLHNNAFDPTQLREISSYLLLRDAGLPASRTAFAVVYLTVDGLYTDQYVGLFTMVEEVDKSFLKREFGDGKGLLLKPEGLFGGIQYLGDDWKSYPPKYRPKDQATHAQAQRVMEFGKLVTVADDATFRREIDQILNVDGFLRFLAMNTLLANLDSYLSFGHNFYLYLNPRTNKFEFISWDLNLSLGAFGWVGAPEDQIRLSVMQPALSGNRLIERILAIDAFAAAYRQHLRQFTDQVLEPRKIAAQLAQLQTLVGAAQDFERRAKSPSRRSSPTIARWEAPPDIARFLAARARSVHEQLEGRDPGYHPHFKTMGLFGRAQPDQPATQPATRPATRPARPQAR